MTQDLENATNTVSLTAAGNLVEGSVGPVLFCVMTSRSGRDREEVIRGAVKARGILASV